MATNGISTNGTSASIYYGIKPVYVGLGERCSFPFTGAAAAIAAAAAVVRA